MRASADENSIIAKQIEKVRQTDLYLKIINIIIIVFLVYSSPNSELQLFNHYVTLLYFSVSTHGVIVQFCRLYFAVLSPLNLKVVPFPHA